MRLVRRGVPTQAVEHFLKAAGLPFNLLDPKVISLRTFKRRKQTAQPLAQDESDRLLRVVGIVAAAEEMFGNSDKAQLWLNRKNRALDDETPFAMADTDRGARAVEALLGRIERAALSLLVNQGSAALTLRRIAAESGMNVGNLNYYFRSKEELIRELLNAVISSYEESFDEIIHEPGASAEARLENLVMLILEDITTKKTTRFFPELWAMANHDPFVHDRMNELYERARVSLNELIAEINPALPDDEREILALFISGSMEGLTMFAGFEKPWNAQMPMLEIIARRSFVHLARTLRPGEIKQNLAPAASGA